MSTARRENQRGARADKGERPSAELTVNSVYHPVIAGTGQLRYEAGGDAVHFLASRRATNDATLFQGSRRR